MKLPRNPSAEELIKVMLKRGYIVSRQRGSLIRLTRTTDQGTHNITIPNHNPIKLGTLSSILNDVCSHLKISKEELLG